MSTIWIEKQEKCGSRIKKDFVILECIKEKMAYFYWDSGLLKEDFSGDVVVTTCCR